MPRRTHPRPVRKHDRAHTRFHAARMARRRWRQAKDRYQSLSCLHPEDARRHPGHPDAWWPFTLSWNQLGAYNPFTLCSCPLCAYRPEQRRARRRRENRAWQKAWMDWPQEPASRTARFGGTKQPYRYD